MRFNQELLGKKIRRLRMTSGMSQEELAEKAHTERSYIAKIETGIRACSVDLIVNLSDIFKVSTDYLLLEVSREKDAKEELLIVIEKLLGIVEKL